MTEIFGIDEKERREHMMKCLSCQQENKDDAQVCRKCGASLIVDPMWKPTWKWHWRTLSIIYVILAVVYFSVSHFLGSVVPEPYKMRHVSKDVTPWLNH